MRNADLLQKADLAIADLASNGGVMNPEQAASFIRKLITPATLLRQIRVVTMGSPQRNINKILFGKRILRKATSGVALDTAAIDGAFNPTAEATARSKPQTEQVVLTTKEVIATVYLPYDVIEDNVEGGNIGGMTDSGGTAMSGGLRDTIVTLIAERAALDLEELALRGDTALAGSDPYLGLNDGYIKILTTSGNVVNAGGDPIDKPIFKAGMKAMPDQYLNNRTALRQMVSVDNETEYRDVLSNRGTALGDAHTTGNNPTFAYGVQVEPVSLMPEANGIFTNPLNLIMGIQRQVSMEFDKDIEARIYKIVITARVDFKVEESTAAVVYTNIG